MIRVGDKLTISGVYLNAPNPAWRWWAFWRPRRIATSDLQTFRVVGATSSEIKL